MAHKEKIKPILEDLENKECEIAGGSVVGMIISITNSLINYICNLTIGKKSYEQVQTEVINIKKSAEKLRDESLDIIDKDKEILQKILLSYKTRKNEPENYQKTNKEAVEFCVEVTKKAVETLKLVNRISKVGNKMLSSDFKISQIYAFASVQASIVNIEINLKYIQDEEFKNKMQEKYHNMCKEAESLMQNL